jgi:hypothetical protein
MMRTERWRPPVHLAIVVMGNGVVVAAGDNLDGVPL